MKIFTERIKVIDAQNDLYVSQVRSLEFITTEKLLCVYTF